MTRQEKLLNKYYKGETTLQEEKELKTLLGGDETGSPEQAIFGYFDVANSVPDELEASVFAKLKTAEKRGGKMSLYQWISIAATIVVVLAVYLDFRNRKNQQIEEDFMIMEQALYQVSESIQPDIQEDMLVLWVDDNVEIIIN